MRTSAGVIAAGLMLIVAVTQAVAGGDPVHFAYEMEEGYSQNFKVKFNQDTDMGFFTMSAFVDMEVTEKCISADTAGYHMEMAFNKVETSRMFQDKMQQDPMGDRLTGGKVTYTVDRHGKVTKLKPVGFIEGWTQAKQVVKPIIESGYSFLPDEEIPAGGEWGKDAETEKNEQGMEVTTTSTYKYKEAKKEKGRECAVVSGKRENVITGEADTAQGPMTADGKGEGKFEMYFDLAKHTIVKLKASMDIRMDLVPDGGGDTIETTINYSLEREIM